MVSTTRVPALVKRRPWYGLSERAVRLGLKPLVFAVSLGPAASLMWAALTHQLNVNPFDEIVRSTGFWSLRFLCLTLAPESLAVDSPPACGGDCGDRVGFIEI